MRFLVSNKHELTAAIIFWIIAVILTIAGTFFFINNPLGVAIILAVIVIIIGIINNLRLGLYLIIFLPVIGELYRFPAGPAGPILLSDIIIPIFLLIWVWKSLRHPTTATNPSDIPNRLPPLTKPLSTFILAAIASLLFSLTFLSPNETISGSLYLIRFIIYISLYFATLSILKNAPAPEQRSTHAPSTAPVPTPTTSGRLLIAITLAALFIAIAGFIQLVIYPDLTPLEELGWDPHINRLVSTWLDPNFVGGFFAFIIVILTALLLTTPRAQHPTYPARHRMCLAHPISTRLPLLIPLLTLTVALFLTYSRSAYLALAAGLLVVTLIKSRKLLLIIIIIAALGISASPRAQQRVGELAQSTTAIFTDSAQTPDPTARLRLQSWQQTWQIYSKHPILGVGYNNLRVVNHREGFVEATENHAAGGSDSSLLTILATTGIIGLLGFIAIYFSLIKRAIKTLRTRASKTPPLTKALALGILGGTTSLFVHSIFVNSLLFANIMIYFWITAAIFIHATTKTTSAHS